MDLAVATNHNVKLKESEKRDKYLGLTKELKKRCDMKVTVTPITIEALGTITKGLIKGLGLVSLFNGISTFVGYLMPKTFF